MSTTARASEQASPQRAPRQLLRVLGVAFGLAIIVGNTIGMGILRTPGDIAARLPSVPLFLGAWVVGGVYAMLGALSLAELGAMIPRSGGQYVFVRHALGPYAGFVVGWSDWLSTTGTVSAVAIVFGEYTGALVPSLAAHGTAVACLVVLAFAMLQWGGVRWGDRTQQLITLLKAVALIALVIAIFAWGSGAHAAAASAASTASTAAPGVPASSAGLGLLAALVLSLQGVIYTYDGWNGVIYFSEEVRDPGHDIPRSMFLGVVSVIVVYLSLNVAFLHVLPIHRMAGDPFVAGAAASAVFGPNGDTVIRVVMLVSLLATINASTLMASRVPFAMSRDGLLPARAAQVNEGGTPTWALAAGTAVALAFILTGTFDEVLALLAFYFVLNYLLSFTSLFVLRRREPDAPRPYRVWGYPWTTGIALAGSCAFVIGSIVGDRVNSVRSLILLALSYPAYLLVKRALGARGPSSPDTTSITP
ncbi:MAG TPA: APC family permease [Gemmatimonadaceae bacterium]